MSKSSNIRKIEVLKVWVESLKRLPGYRKPKPKKDRWEKEAEEVEYMVKVY